MLSKIIAIAGKEIMQIRRDRRSLIIIFLLPVILLVLFGYAITLDVKDITMSVLDKDNSRTSRDFVSSLTGSGYFKVVSVIESDNEINEILDKRKAQCVLVIPVNFANDLAAREKVKVQFDIDGIDASTATIIMNYTDAATRTFSGKLSAEYFYAAGIKMYRPIDPESQFWYNKDLNTTKYFIPGLIAMILIIISVILTSISLVKEKEFGTIEQIKVSPVNTFSLIIGKIIPYMIISLLIAFFIIVAGYFLFDVEVKGSYAELLLGTICYLLSTLALGVFISTVANSQQVAFQIAMLISQLPTVILSGFIFPIESMPKAIQILTYIVPAKYYIIILRDILLKGVGIEVYYKELISLCILAMLLILLAVKRTAGEKKV